MNRKSSARAGALRSCRIRPALIHDLNSLDRIERGIFANDRLSRRRLRHWISAANGILLVAEDSQGLLAYGLVILRQGTQGGRLYSIAVSERGRGRGLGKRLMQELEARTLKKQRSFMRLEVATDNHSAIRLYEELGYQIFARYPDYYENHQDALRMQKRLRKE
jgi:ribosomal protein S18 acetylase RimI-like enzyme